MVHPPIILLTDFGLSDGYPGVMKGVIYSFSPEVPIIDLSHNIPPHNLRAAAFLLFKNHRYFPENSIFVVVVDPGVGSHRKILYLHWRDWHFLAPDNGVLSPFLINQEWIRELREVTQSDLFLVRRGNTFDGRDRFAPVAAHLARGFDSRELGPEVSQPVFLEELIPKTKIAGSSLVGEVVYVDCFGNLITTIEESDLESWGGQGTLYADLAGQKIPVVLSYSDVESGKALAVIGGFGTLEIAVNQGSAYKMLRIPVGQTIRIIKE